MKAASLANAGTLMGVKPRSTKRSSAKRSTLCSSSTPSPFSAYEREPATLPMRESSAQPFFSSSCTWSSGVKAN
jgi:hypothetical protein